MTDWLWVIMLYTGMVVWLSAPVFAAVFVWRWFRRRG